MPSYVYRKSELNLWTVGYIAPGGCGPNRDFHPESDHDSEAKAAARVHWLNGGAPDVTVPDPFKDRHFKVLEAMIEHGGSFVSDLGRAWRRADSENHARLYRAFAHYYDQYEKDWVR